MPKKAKKTTVKKQDKEVKFVEDGSGAMAIGSLAMVLSDFTEGGLFDKILFSCGAFLFITGAFMLARKAKKENNKLIYLYGAAVVIGIVFWIALIVNAILIKN